MDLYRFLREEAPQALRTILLMSTISGIAGGALVVLVNAASSIEASDAPPSEAQPRLVVMFVLTLAILLYSKRHSLTRSTEIVEEKLKELQIRICNKIRRADLQTMESLNQDVVITTVTQNTQIISQSVFAFSNACQQAFMLVCGLIYLGTLSIAAVVLFVVVGIAASFYYKTRTEEVRAALAANSKKSAEFYSYLTHLLHGFKELSLNRAKNEDLSLDLDVVAHEASQYATQSNAALAKAIVVGDLAFFLLAGSVVFILPQMVSIESDTLVKATIAVMYTIGPLGAVVGSAPQIANAEIALETLYELEANLNDVVAEYDEVNIDDTLMEFKTIELKGVCFSYLDAQGRPTFSVGPCDMEIKNQEILFIVGGNGSGKSTLLKLITGLYRPQQGALLVDGTSIDVTNAASFRSLFAGVFADFHLFPRLYGVGEIDYELANSLLRELEIENKVRVEEGRFTTLDLSTGQRKRLALLAALLEDRKVYVFDEWTADQDPHFRERFYYETLPRLRERGKTIIAITHDDRYWDCADRVIKLDYGKIVEVRSGTGPPRDRDV